MADKVVSVRLQALTAAYTGPMAQATATTAQFGTAAAAAGTATATSGTKIATSATTAGGAMARMSAVGMGLRTAVANPMAAIASPAGLAAIAVVATAKAAIDFESAWAGVTKTVEGTPAQLASIREGIRDMAREMPASTTEIAKVAEAAGQLGIETDSILGFSKVMIDLGNTTNLASDEAATALARLANITQMPQTEFDRLGATIVDLGNNFATTEAEIVQMGVRIAGAGHQVGLTEAEILSFATALSSVGIEAQAGGTAISRVMIDMSKAVDDGGDKLRTLAQVAGVTSQEFATRFRDDAAGAIAMFVEGLGRMKAGGESVFPVLEELGFSEIRVRDALLRTSGAGDLLNQTLETGTAAWEENSALTDEAAKRYGTTASQLEILWNNITDLAISLGDAFLPALNAVLGPLADLVGLLSDLVGLIPDLRGQLGDGTLAVDTFSNGMINWASVTRDSTDAAGELTEAQKRQIDELTRSSFATLHAAEAQGELAGATDETAKEIVRFANMTSKEIKEWRDGVTSSFDVVQAAFGDIGDEAVNTAEEVFEAFRKQIRAVLDFEDNMRQLAQKGLPPQAAAIIASMGDVGAKVASIFADESKANVGKFGAQLLRAQGLSADTADRIIDIYNSLKDKTPGIGHAASSGLAAGITAGKSEVINAAAAVAIDAITTAKHLLAVKSPSQVFFEIGMATMEGLALGIIEGTKRHVVDAATGSAKSIDRVFRRIMKGSFAGGRAKFGDLFDLDLSPGAGDTDPTFRILDFLHLELENANRFAIAMGQITAAGGGLGLNPDLARQIAEAGPDGLALAEAIAAGGPSLIAQINTLFGQIQSVSVGKQTINASTATVNATNVRIVGPAPIPISRPPISWPISPFAIRGGDGASAGDTFIVEQVVLPNIAGARQAEEFFGSIRRVVRQGV